MTYVGRLRAVGAVLALAAVLTTTHLWGTASQKEQNRGPGSKRFVPAKGDEVLTDELADTKFAKGGAITYRTTDGETLFALQLQPKLDPPAARPRDILLLVDTSASQVKLPLGRAQVIVGAVINNARPQDRISLWTANTPKATRDLTHGFHGAKSPAVEAAYKALMQEVPLGDTDLKGAVLKTLAQFEPTRERQQLVIYLGDGMSVHDPISAADRARLCAEMVKNQVAFFAVPLGPRTDPANIHGLTTGTGGTVVRILPQDKAEDTLQRLTDALAAPVLYPQTVQFTAAVKEAFPTTLPPLRADAPTLVVGRVQPGQPIGYTVEGRVAGQEVKIQGSEPAPQEGLDNFFLVSMYEQWKNGKDQPALTRADRALAYAYEQNQLARADLLAQAEWALGQDKLDAAHNLFEQAKKLDPHDAEADAGLQVVEKLKAGALSKEQLKAQLVKQEKPGTAKAQPPADAAAPANQEPILQELKQRAAVEEQRVARTVDDAQREARQLLQSDPDAARDLLKRIYAAVRDNPDLTDRARQTFTSRLELALRNVEVQGSRIKQDREDRQRLAADAARRVSLDQARVSEEERTRARMQRFTNLMAQARYEDATVQALAIMQDAISSGRGVPPAATASYDISLAINNLSQIQELRRVREERFLLAMMQVERSHVPFPDEPPIQYPPSAVWREITRLRKEKYESQGFTDDDPATIRALRALKEKLSKPISMDKLEPNTKLSQVVDLLEARYDVPIVVDEAALKADNGVEVPSDTEVQMPKITNVSLATYLRLLTSKINATYLVRRDFIEITTGKRALVEKVVRVYPVADLVIPIPNDVNRQIVNQALTILGTAPGLGLQLGSPATLGAIGQGLGIGQGLNLGGIGLGAGGGIGGLGGLGGLGGGLGGGGGGFGGALGLGGQGQVNLGAGGGALGFGGGQLGQFGNLGGQFGLQGGDQSTILVELIRQVVGRQDEWQRPGAFQRPQGNVGPVNPAGAPGDEEETERLPYELLNALGYYPPARALVVKGTSRIHTNLGGGPVTRAGAMAALDRKRDEALARMNQRKNGGQANDAAVAKVKGGKDDQVARAPINKKELAQRAAADPKQLWQDALAQGVNDPGLIIAVADFLAERKMFDHVTEFLKANLRQGIVVRPWVYEALAIAMEASKADPDEIERARVSLVDLQPQDAQSYVRAAKAMADLNRFDRAVAFCRQASLLEPNAPLAYEEALLYAELAKDADAMQWAAGHLLNRDWPSDNQDLHARAQSKLRQLADRLQTTERKADADRMVHAVERVRQRDLVIKLSWAGEADLDLEVKEPIGTKCSFMQRQTPGGGILLGDTLSDTSSESYIAAKAFSGDYEVTVRRIWGRPLGGKATLEIVQHQGSPQETRHRETVTIDRQTTLKVALDSGRRTAAEFVPPTSATRRDKPKSELASTGQIFNQLRAVADANMNAGDNGFQAGVTANGMPVIADAAPSAEQQRTDLLGFQTRVAPLVASSCDLTAQTVVGKDHQLEVKLTPVFQSVNKSATMPAINNPLIPGSFESSEQ